MPRLVKRTPISAAEARDLVVQYCHDRIDGIGGGWRQEPNKSDFLNIFYTAYYNGFVGVQAVRKLTMATRRKRNAPIADYVVSADTILEHLRANWKPRQEHAREVKQMTAELLTWWQDWTYAWDKHPNRIARRYFRKA